jgi:hypothetical protein
VDALKRITTFYYFDSLLIMRLLLDLVPSTQGSAAKLRPDMTLPNRIGKFYSTISWIDVAICTLLICFGAFQFFCVSQAKDFARDDVFFVDAARGVAQHGFYGINGYPETNMPPGLAWTFALLGIVLGFGHAFLLRALVVFATLSFLASYLFLRLKLPRLVAGAICLLLSTSPIHFEFVTQIVFSCYPYLFTSMAALLVAQRFEESVSLRSRTVWGTLLATFVAASLFYVSAGIAFLGAIVASIAVTSVKDRRLALSRLKMYLPILLVGVVVQGFWMVRGTPDASAGISATEWPIGGFPRSYVAQLKMKNGNDPELGTVTPRDLVVRVLKNASAQADLLMVLFTRWPFYVTSLSIFVLGPILLIALGWVYSVWSRGAGGLHHWYFAGYEFIYLLWPWALEARFLFPIVPLAGLYLWRGGEALAFIAKKNPRLLGSVWFPLSVPLMIGSWMWVRGSGFASHMPNAGCEDEISFAVWFVTAVIAAWMIYAGGAWPTQASALLQRCFSRVSPLGALGIAKAFGALAVIAVSALMVQGLAAQMQIASANVDPHSTANQLTPDAEAGLWIRSHTDPQSIVMARHVPTVYHYGDRKVIWFPPSSDPQLLIDGIRRHKIDYLVVIRRQYSYYLPEDEVCFAPLFKAYPDAFQLVYEASDIRIFRVQPTS